MKIGDKFKYIVGDQVHTVAHVVTLIEYRGEDLWTVKENNVLFMETGEALFNRYEKVN